MGFFRLGFVLFVINRAFREDPMRKTVVKTLTAAATAIALFGFTANNAQAHDQTLEKVGIGLGAFALGAASRPYPVQYGAGQQNHNPCWAWDSQLQRYVWICRRAAPAPGTFYGQPSGYAAPPPPAAYGAPATRAPAMVSEPVTTSSAGVQATRHEHPFSDVPKEAQVRCLDGRPVKPGDYSNGWCHN